MPGRVNPNPRLTTGPGCASGWMLGYFSAGETLSLELQGYDYPDGKHADPASVSVDARLFHIMAKYGLDTASSYWFGQAAANAALYEHVYLGEDEFATQVTGIVEAFQRDQEMYDHLSGWDKYKHEILAGLGVVLLIGTLIAAPYASPEVTALLLATDAGTAVADAALYALDGQWGDAVVSAAFVLVPIGIGAGLKWVRMSRAEFEIVQAGGRVGDVTQDGIRAGFVQSGASIRPRDMALWWTWADARYDAFRAANDVPSIARTLDGVKLPSGVTLNANDIQAIKNHLFFEEHPLTDYETGGVYMDRYNGSPPMAEAWQRLTDGHPLDSDLLLLDHEFAEMRYYQSHPGAAYAEAHTAANEIANWQALGLE